MHNHKALAQTVHTKHKFSFGQLFPIASDLKDYNKQSFISDLIAGLTVGVMLVPQGMAYATLAGMPVIYGLYSSVIPLILYALLGTSRQLSIGPVAVSSTLILSGVSQVISPDTDINTYISLVVLTGLMVGIAQMLMSFAKLGFLVNFLSRPVIAGFTSAAAIIILFSQLKDFLGMDITRSSAILDAPMHVLSHLSDINVLTFAIGIIAIVAMLLLKKLGKNVPDALIVVIIGTLLCWQADFSRYGVQIIESIPSGLPPFAVPNINWADIQALVPTIFTVTLIGVVECIGIAKAIESNHDEYEIKPNQELFAIGVSKIGGAFFSAFPTSGSFTRSAVNDLSGAKTNVASLITALVIILTLGALTPLFYYLPKAILAAIVILSVRSLFKLSEAKRLWRADRNDFWMMIATFVATLILGIELGVATGLVLSLVSVLYRSSKPHMAILGRVPGTQIFRNINRFNEAQQAKGTLIVRFDQQLYFANASYFKETIRKYIHEHPDDIQQVFLDAKGISDIDSTGLQALVELNESLKKQGVKLMVCNTIGPVRDTLDMHNADHTDKAIKMSLFLHNAVEDIYK